MKMFNNKDSKLMIRTYIFDRESAIIIIIVIKNEFQCKAGREWEHALKQRTPTPHNQPVI